MQSTRTMLERRRVSARSWIAALFLAGAAHIAAVGLLLIPTLFPSAPEPEPIVFVIDPYRAPKLGGGGVREAKPAPTQRVRAEATPQATPDFVQPQAIPVATPIPDDTAIPADDTALAANDAGTGPIGDPNAPIGPGVPTGRADSECRENCDENGPAGLSGFPGPIPSHLLAIAPVAIDQPQPKYPPSARNANITGAVVVEIIVGVDGRVQSAKVVRGGAPFAAPTLEAVKRWRYMPVMHRGRPIVWKSNVTIRFQLD